MEQQTLLNPQKNLITNIDTHKVDKYIPRLVNGELYKLETWLPNILSAGGITSRERYDYRIGQYKNKNKPGHNTHINTILQKIELYKQHDQQRLQQEQTDRREILHAFSQYKHAVDQHHENTRQNI